MGDDRDPFREHMEREYTEMDGELYLYERMDDRQRELCRRVGIALHEAGVAEGRRLAARVRACRPVPARCKFGS